MEHWVDIALRYVTLPVLAVILAYAFRAKSYGEVNFFLALFGLTALFPLNQWLFPVFPGTFFNLVIHFVGGAMCSWVFIAVLNLRHAAYTASAPIFLKIVYGVAVAVLCSYVWELFELFAIKPAALQRWTSFSLYFDTMLDLGMGLLGGATVTFVHIFFWRVESASSK